MSASGVRPVEAPATMPAADVELLRAAEALLARVWVDGRHQVATALRTADGQTPLLEQVADIVEEPGEVELNREDLRQYVAVTAALEHRDLGSAIAEIKAKLKEEEGGKKEETK